MHSIRSIYDSRFVYTHIPFTSRRPPKIKRRERPHWPEIRLVQCPVPPHTHNTALCPSHNNQFITIVRKCIIHGRKIVILLLLLVLLTTVVHLTTAYHCYELRDFKINLNELNEKQHLTIDRFYNSKIISNVFYKCKTATYFS